MKKYRVLLYTAFGPTFATAEGWGGKALEFETESEAETYAKASPLCSVYEVVETKPDSNIGV